jgi:hypothetical protein
MGPIVDRTGGRRRARHPAGRFRPAISGEWGSARCRRGQRGGRKLPCNRHPEADGARNRRRYADRRDRRQARGRRKRAGVAMLDDLAAVRNILTVVPADRRQRSIRKDKGDGVRRGDQGAGQRLMRKAEQTHRQRVERDDGKSAASESPDHIRQQPDGGGRVNAGARRKRSRGRLSASDGRWPCRAPRPATPRHGTASRRRAHREIPRARCPGRGR